MSSRASTKERSAANSSHSVVVLTYFKYSEREVPFAPVNTILVLVGLASEYFRPSMVDNHVLAFLELRIRAGYVAFIDFDAFVDLECVEKC